MDQLSFDQMVGWFVRLERNQLEIKQGLDELTRKVDLLDQHLVKHRSGTRSLVTRSRLKDGWLTLTPSPAVEVSNPMALDDENTPWQGGPSFGMHSHRAIRNSQVQSQ